MFSWSWLSSGLFLGWSLGSNDASHVFGTAVASRAISFRTAAICFCIFVLIGAYAQGGEGIHTLSKLSEHLTIQAAFSSAFAAALAVAVMTVLRMPVSTSQAIVGSIIGITMALGRTPDWGSLPKIAICWVGTPIGAMILSAGLYIGLGKIWDRLSSKYGMQVLDSILVISLIVVGSYGSYALGANNIANVVGVFAGFAPFDHISTNLLGLIGAAAVCVGVVTYSKRVMFTVGQDLVELETFTAFITVLAEAITVHVYAVVGVPVSTSQAIVGAVLGIGIIKGAQSVHTRTLISIVAGWITTPILSAAFAFGFYKLVFAVLLHP